MKREVHSRLAVPRISGSQPKRQKMFRSKVPVCIRVGASLLACLRMKGWEKSVKQGVIAIYLEIPDGQPGAFPANVGSEVTYLSVAHKRCHGPLGQLYLHGKILRLRRVDEWAIVDDDSQRGLWRCWLRW